jgi:hypothetical protein
MVEKIVESTFSSSNMHGVVDDNSNRHRSIVMDSMGMNQSDAGECSIIDEESNTNSTNFLIF